VHTRRVIHSLWFAGDDASDVSDDWRMNQFHSALSEALDDAEGVLTAAAALRHMSEDQLRWKITSGRWQKPARGVVVAQSGPLTERQMLRVTLLAAGPHAALAGLTAARLDGLTGFGDKSSTIHEQVVGFPRRKLILDTLGDIAGGAQALSELDFTRNVVRAFRLPEPTRQAARRDARGRRRWTDVSWDACRLVVEIDGAQHTEDPRQRWDDMERDIDLGADGYQTLRFPAWLVRQDPQRVARTIRLALHRAGYRG
jgi:hypothetical protein